jgi:hypothetical protein
MIIVCGKGSTVVIQKGTGKNSIPVYRKIEAVFIQCYVSDSLLDRPREQGTRFTISRTIHLNNTALLELKPAFIILNNKYIFFLPVPAASGTEAKKTEK